MENQSEQERDSDTSSTETGNAVICNIQENEYEDESGFFSWEKNLKVIQS